ncbi:site-specific integrase [Sunxiuqinia indica]|uniref:site-specific integrase n=1 Tax=Sunxiuqinia indica TaxID=2692584 RepID=UPI001356CB96|nr:site-specific integrase [Sunxiuqinia indica]
MAKVYFKVLTKIQDPHKDVNIRIRFKEGKIDQSTITGESVRLRYWDLDKQCFRRTHFKGKDQLTSRLKKLEYHVLEKAAQSDSIKKGWLLLVVDQYLHPQKYIQKSDQSMFEWIEAWIDVSPNTYHAIRPYHSALKNIRDFRPDLDWNKIDVEFYYDFVRYLTKLGYSKNTIASRIKNLKVFCNASYERNLHQNIAYQSFKKQTEDSFNIYLNEEELASIFKLDLSDKPHLERVRDIFLVGCWTGCRFSDLFKVNKENISGEFIHLEQQKTQKRVIIPLHLVVKTILDKYNGKLPEMISNQKFNSYIKEVCKMAELKGKVSKNITKGGERTAETLEKWQMVRSHTARRSFATNLYKSGFPSISIMAITGHKTEKAFYSYIKVKEEEHAEMLLKHWSSSIVDS